MSVEWATIEPIAPERAAALVSWLLGEADAATVDPLEVAGDARWLLAHCDDGVIWGTRRGGGWSLSSGLFGGVSPPLHADEVQQLRLFGEDREVLLWRGVGGLVGRVLARAQDGDPLCRPLGAEFVVLGDRRIDGADDFTLVGDAAGSRHAVPLELAAGALRDGRRPLRLRVTHHLGRDADTGAVRVVASRLRDLVVAGGQR